MDKTVLVQEETQDDSNDEDLSAEESSHEEGQPHKQKLAFAIDPQIDINSHALLDMISEEAVVVDQPLPSAHAKTATECKEISVDEAFDDW
jgi:hypothetical protein